MSVFDFKSTTRDEVRRPAFLVGSALIVLAAVIYGLTRELTTAGYVMSVVFVVLTISALAFLVLPTGAPRAVRFIMVPTVTVLLFAAAAAGAFGSLTKQAEPLPPSSQTAPVNERVTYNYTDKITVLDDCTPFEIKVPEGVTVEAQSQTDSAVVRTAHCDVTIDWSRYGVRAMPTRDGVSNLNELDSRVNYEGKELTLTVPIGTRVDVFLYEPGRPTQPVGEAMMALYAFEATVNR